MSEGVSRVALGAARTAGRATGQAGEPITACPYPAGPLRFAFIDAYLQAAPPAAGTVSYDDGQE
ncbi:Rmf/CrpP family protein (plasmid) [Streptosporangium sandarakinum]|uniref:Rmf/CrpP family protein n=1 Tax=Streptosporangium sandarakinum TaxID=1260955 RepID=UPI003D8B06F7